MQARIPVKAYEHGSAEFPSFPDFKSVVYPETMRVLRNTLANAGSKVVYLYFKAMENEPIRANIGEPFHPPVCGKVCANCKHYRPYFCNTYKNEMRQDDEGRCQRARVDGKRVKETKTCEHWEAKER